MSKGCYDRVWLRGHVYSLRETECPECGKKIQSKRKDTLCSECREKHLKLHWKKVETSRDLILKKDQALKRTYGITLDQYKELFEQQEGKCRICGKHSDECPRSLDVDHNHTNGKIRGLLCNKCNQALGLFNDNVDTLRRAIEYLEK